MVFGVWYLTHLDSVPQYLTTFTLHPSYIFLLCNSLIGSDSLDLLASDNIMPHPSCDSLSGHHYSHCCYPHHCVIFYIIILFCNSTSYIHPASTITEIVHDTYIHSCRLHSLLFLYLIDNISHHHHRYTQFCDFQLNPNWGLAMQKVYLCTSTEE